MRHLDARENILDHTKDLWGQKGNKSPKLSVRGIRGRKNCVELEKPKLYIPRDVARKERGRLLSSRGGRIVSSHNANKKKIVTQWQVKIVINKKNVYE